MAYTAVSVRLHQRLLSSGFDLGIFEQAVRSYAHLKLPLSELKGHDFQLLGDHFSPVLATLAPFYRLFPSPLTLLIAQAALLAIAVIPLVGWAERTLGRWPAAVVTAGYGASWGVAQAVGFDFHEVCFAVPLIAFAVVALGEGRLGAAAAWAWPLVLVKEDFGLTAAIIGVLVAGKGARRLGLITVAIGIFCTTFETLVIIPSFSEAGRYPYWDKLPLSNESPTSGPVHLLYEAAVGMVTPDAKVMTLLALAAPTAFLAARSSLILVVVPTLAWRFLSDNSYYWGTGFHYSAVLMPVAFAAFVDSLARRPNIGIRYALSVSGVVTYLMALQTPLYQLFQSDTWQTDTRVAKIHQVLDGIPNGVTVAATNRLAPQLTNRTTVTLLGLAGSGSNPEYIVADLSLQEFPFIDKLQQITEARNHGYLTITDQDGIVLLRRK
ncbi:DUF2079 domain-containing protein [Streptomyces sp. NPDC055085]